MRTGSCPAKQSEAGVFHRALLLPPKHSDTCKELARAGEPWAGCECSFQEGCERERGAWFDLAEGEMSAAKEAWVQARSWEVGRVSHPVPRSQKLKCLCLRNVCLSFIPRRLASNRRESKLAWIRCWNFVTSSAAWGSRATQGPVSASKGEGKKRTRTPKCYFH